MVTTEIVYDNPEANIYTSTVAHPRQRNRQFLFSLLFLFGSIIAAIGWFADWEQLAERIPLFRYSVLITVAGHALQVIGAFGSLLTPDYVEWDSESAD